VSKWTADYKNMKTETPQIIRLSTPHMSGREMKYVVDAMERNQVFPLGQNVADFENALRIYSGAGACSCLSSGTAAIHIALIILGVQPGDEVICSTFTFAASANPIVYLKAIPVFIDSEPSTWNMDPNLLRQAIQERIRKTGKKPKLILLVHLYGMPADMEGIMAISKEFDIPVLEDAAEALGSTYDGRHCGTSGIMGVYSFNGNKIITTSGGGALISSNETFCRQAIFLATQARDEGVYAVAAYDRSLFDKPLGHVVQYRAIEELKKRKVSWYKIGVRPYGSDNPRPTDKEIKIGEFKQGFSSHCFPHYRLIHRVVQQL